MPRLPEALEELVGQLAKLPGLGPKSALRMAMTLLKWPEARTRELGMAIAALRDRLHLCSRCGALSDADPCAVCEDPRRDPASLCLVAEWDSFLALEDGGFYGGLYMILGGLLDPLEGAEARDLELERLNERLAEGQVTELILALGTTLEAENTASHIRNLAARRFPQVKVTRLAQGIPLGSEVKYIDKETLRQSLKHRQDL